MAKIIGAKAHAERLRRMAGPEMKQKLSQALYDIGDAVKVEAQISITTGATSAKGQHKPSAPGTPPNNDTAVLANNIEAALVRPLKVEVSSNAPYAAALEFGTSKMAERPYMRPAVAKVRAEGGVVKEIVSAVNSVIGGRSLSEAKRRSKQETQFFGGAKGGEDK